MLIVLTSRLMSLSCNLFHSTSILYVESVVISFSMRLNGVFDALWKRNRFVNTALCTATNRVTGRKFVKLCAFQVST